MTFDQNVAGQQRDIVANRTMCNGIFPHFWVFGLWPFSSWRKKEVSLYSALFVVPHTQALRYGWHSITCNYTNACIYLVSVRIPRLRLRTSHCSLLLIYLPQKDKRLSLAGWLTYSGQFTHLSGHQSAAGRAQDPDHVPLMMYLLLASTCQVHLLTNIQVSSLKYVGPFWRMDPRQKLLKNAA